MSQGTKTETLAHLRDIFGWALQIGAPRIEIVHNHPSGELSASSADIHLTQQLLQASEILGIPILDHLILGNGDFSSLRQTTVLWQESSVTA